MDEVTLLLEHALPGKVRLRVPKPRTARRVETIGRRLRACPRVQAVEVNAETGSVYIRFQPDHPLDAILDDVRRLGYDVEAAANQAPAVDPATHSGSAALVQQALAALDRRLHQATDGTIDLRALVPLMFLVLAIRQLTRDAGRIRDAPWYQLLYWAFDSFEKLHPHRLHHAGGGPGGRRAT